ncbi:MAG: NAD(P)-dependent oxidoreductase [Kiritimatiellae bacterium]|nr:NAD(P)-dependent oxidoreductase [Kiritimatiellia bacterium]
MSRAIPWKGRTVLVTGATGFIGTRLCSLLHDAGADVHGLGRSRPAHPQPGVTYHRADLSVPGAADRLIRRLRPTCIFHLASHVAGARDIDLVAPTFTDNLSASVRVMLAAARVPGARVILAGSLEEPEARHGPMTPSSPYAASKAAVTLYARMFHALYALPVVHARLFMVYGPGQRDLRKLVPYTILSLLDGVAPKVSAGRRPVDWIYVDDAARGLMALGQTPGIEGGSFDLGTGVLTTVRSVVLRLTRIVRPDLSPQWGAAPTRPLEQVKRARVNATWRATGWRPRMTLDEGLKKTVAFYRKNRM